MKTRILSNKGFNGLCLALGLISLPDQVKAAENIIYNFNDAGSASFTRWWGAAVQTYEFDAATDADNNPSSGSQKITAVFNLASYGGDNQFAAQYNPGSINGVDYTNFVFDIRFDPSSPQRTSGDYGALEYGLIPSDFSQIQLGTAVITNTAGWTRIQARIDPATPKLESVRGVWFKIWSGAAGGLTGTSIMWIDNVSLYANTNVAPPPPPTIAMAKANQGIRIFASQPGQQYQRQSVYTRTSSTNYSWVGAPGPVTYSLTVADYPDPTHSGFQSHLFIVPGNNLPDWESSPDYNEPNLIFLDIGNGTDGGGYASFRYKTNLPNGNGMVYNANPANGPVGTLASIGNPTPNGTWSITFNNNTQVTLTSPNGSVTNFALPAAAVDLFTNALHVYAGGQPNQPGNIGQSLTLKRVAITGIPTPINEDFSTPGVLAGTTWNISAGDRTGLVEVPADAVFWMSWALPDTGWTMQWAEDLENNFWNDFPFGTSANIGGQRQTLIRTGDLPQSFFGNYFFQMIRR